MSNILPLPAGPFFLDSQGRYLPSLTELVVEFAAFQQRVEIMEQLFALRLKRKCFVRLAQEQPLATVARLKLFPVSPGGSIDGFTFKSDSSSALPQSLPCLTISNETVPTNVIRNDPPASPSFDPMNAYPKGRW